MCFSAELSFGAATLLLATGIHLIAKERYTKRSLLAFIPLFFGIQHLAEGFLWVGLQNPEIPMWEYGAQVIYIFFLLLFWPIWLPMAFLVAEKVQWRRISLFLLLLYGLGIMGFTGYNFFAHKGIIPFPVILHHSMNYTESSLITEWLYAIGVIGPFFVSSLDYSWILALSVMGLFMTVNCFYLCPFASFWCVLAVLISGGVFLLLRIKKKRKKRVIRKPAAKRVVKKRL